ncbi:hypothetical protein LRR80_01976 [Streptomyces sp. RO-S4]|nr:hypothetical protein [Streptomyces sp. RO-S4]
MFLRVIERKQGVAARWRIREGVVRTSGGVAEDESVSEDCRVTLADTEREVWEHTPYEAVGPLRFGVGREEAVDVMAGLGR